MYVGLCIRRQDLRSKSNYSFLIHRTSFLKKLYFWFPSGPSHIFSKCSEARLPIITISLTDSTCLCLTKIFFFLIFFAIFFSAFINQPDIFPSPR